MVSRACPLPFPFPFLRLSVPFDRAPIDDRLVLFFGFALGLFAFAFWRGLERGFFDVDGSLLLTDSTAS